MLGVLVASLLSFGYVPLELRIRDLQGSAHPVALARAPGGRRTGVVTALRARGFYMQDPET